MNWSRQTPCHQTKPGLLKRRLSSFEIHRLLNILFSAASLWKWGRCLIGWSGGIYLRFGISPQFISRITPLHSSPRLPPVHRNLNISVLVEELARCALWSPSLFASMTECLSGVLKSASFSQVILRCGLEHTLSVYADDLLLFISDLISAPQTIELLNSFGAIKDKNSAFHRVNALM